MIATTSGTSATHRRTRARRHDRRGVRAHRSRLELALRRSARDHRPARAPRATRRSGRATARRSIPRMEPGRRDRQRPVQRQHRLWRQRDRAHADRVARMVGRWTPDNRSSSTRATPTSARRRRGLLPNGYALQAGRTACCACRSCTVGRGEDSGRCKWARCSPCLYQGCWVFIGTGDSNAGVPLREGGVHAAWSNHTAARRRSSPGAALRGGRRRIARHVPAPGASSQPHGTGTGRARSSSTASSRCPKATPTTTPRPACSTSTARANGVRPASDAGQSGVRRGPERGQTRHGCVTPRNPCSTACFDRVGSDEAQTMLRRGG